MHAININKSVIFRPKPFLQYSYRNSFAKVLSDFFLQFYDNGLDYNSTSPKFIWQVPNLRKLNVVKRNSIIKYVSTLSCPVTVLVKYVNKFKICKILLSQG